jgi:hypothetical protein
VSQAGLPPARFHQARFPWSWVPSTRDTAQTGKRDVHQHGNQVGRGTDDVRHGDDRDQGQHSIGHSIRPGRAVPPTVLVADMCDGGLFLQRWRDGPSAYLSPSDATPLRRELAAAFGNRQPARGSNPGGTP